MKLLSSLLICCVIPLCLPGNQLVIDDRSVMEMENTEKPQYLYKILSLKNWQATQNHKTVVLSADDNAFIHFSKEEQLEGVLAKHWSDAKQFVLLKIDASLVEGNWVYESNSEGTRKYFHLYNGFIPFSSIAEVKIIYREPIASCEMSKLDIVQVGDAVLREKARELSIEEIRSPEIQSLIELMTATMRAAPGVGLAAPQIGKSIQLVVIEDMDHGHLTPSQLKERDRSKVPFHIVINPRIYIEEASDKAEFFEGCLSIPNILGVVPRAKSVRVECLNEKAEPVVIHANGWYARILQHEIDHLHGTLCIDRALPCTLTTQENFIKLWKGKSVQEILDILSFEKENN